MPYFPTTIKNIEKLIADISPISYGRTRNYANGAITYLGPYISRGFISTKQIYDHIRQSGHSWDISEKLIQELSWRDYWQQIWIEKGDLIFSDIKQPQEDVIHKDIPLAITNACTGINAVDKAIESLYTNGYMHNHMRMYVASICCNIAKCHWAEPAKWLYYHLLDGDLASNNLSWQWVSGSNAKKKYFANQENINKYFFSKQRNTFLDLNYEALNKMPIPERLKQVKPFDLNTSLKETEPVGLKKDVLTLVYNYYNIDPNWHKDKKAQRILLIEPSKFQKHPISTKCLDFITNLARKNIPNIKIFVCEFKELLKKVNEEHIVFKEHPLNKEYRGYQDARQWISSVKGYYPSFFQFWKKCKKEIKW
tara:strand:+ start:1610 stop:2707 length:1098 start_codon:yes stop_codon:yes gene_type:complete